MLYHEVENAILYEDNHIIIINKPAGVLSQPAQQHEDSIIEYVKNYVKVKYNRPGNVYIHPVHRLDRVVSGCLILSRTTKATTRFNAMIKSQEIVKVYLALVSGQLGQQNGKLTHYLRKDQSKNKVKLYDHQTTGSKIVQLEYQVMAAIRGKSLIKIKLISGRSHQIRSQLSHIGHPIIGDVKYKSQTSLSNRTILLHAHKLSFVHPVKKEEMVFISAPKPNKYWKDFESFIIQSK